MTIVVHTGDEPLCAKHVGLRLEIERHKLLILWLGGALHLIDLHTETLVRRYEWAAIPSLSTMRPLIDLVFAQIVLRPYNILWVHFK